MDEQFKLENQLCFRLYTAARLTMGAYHPYLDPLGITYPQYLVLLVLWEKDHQPVCDIGKRLFLGNQHPHSALAAYGEGRLGDPHARQGGLAPAHRLAYGKRRFPAKSGGRHPRELAQGGGAEIERRKRDGSHARQID